MFKDCNSTRHYLYWVTSSASFMDGMEIGDVFEDLLKHARRISAELGDLSACKALA